MRVNLNVPYRDKDAARAAGARWDAARKVWYWESDRIGNLDKRLLQWMPAHLTRKTTGLPAAPAPLAKAESARVQARCGRT